MGIAAHALGLGPWVACAPRNDNLEELGFTIRFQIDQWGAVEAVETTDE
jgi:hypothetical protein